MGGKPIIFELFGIEITFSIVLSTLITCASVIVFTYFTTKKLSIRPNRGQTVMEMLVNFIKDIVTNNVKWEVAGKPLTIFGTTLFLFILMSNLLDLPFFVEAGGYSFWNAPTANAVVCLVLSLMVILLSHYLGIQRFGFKKYVSKNYLEPVKFLLPLKILEEFTNTLTLALRLYGNIYAGEVLIALLAQMSLAAGLGTIIPAVVLTVIWQAFSVMVAGIQAYVFTTLSMVYIGHKLEDSHD
ncbi:MULTISPECIES: F0F1 ATP synthase subunit A [unclassified Granulicatella]|uniref:F0F1 ATP synthase subunit A n=1 Tax=unclassified Granulicatella TaxID=2630493 RepID=UPI0013D34B4E|nr:MULTISPECIES: F0F1 ATP synthase subunit A [unclassified Granulicatella]MBS4749984.1 F0F1 ATP synthase subunit A [Carnobacteriaceae bacterium zg-ZUI78]QMI86061.1 F0F1 ATP synthase subunit A [Carnobacteriaceae bacterium zg-84]